MVSDHKGTKLEIQSRSLEKSPNIQKLNSMLLDNSCERRSKREIRKHFDMNANKNTNYQNLWDKVEAIGRGKFMALVPILEKKKSIKRITSASTLRNQKNKCRVS